MESDRSNELTREEIEIMNLIGQFERESPPQEMILSHEGQVTVILPEEALQWARLFAAKQPDVDTGKRVYLNTLAVYAVHFFLERSQIETDLEGSDCWYPNLATPFDVADLLLPEIGQIECRPILAGQRQIEVPEDALSDRLAYVGVQFGEVLDRVVLSGAICGKSISGNEIFVREFRRSENAIANLPIFLKRVQERISKRQSDDLLAKVEMDLELSSEVELIAKLERIFLLETDPSLQRYEIEATMKELAQRKGNSVREFAQSHREFAVLSDLETEDLTNDQVEQTFRQMATDLWNYFHKQ